MTRKLRILIIEESVILAALASVLAIWYEALK
jgi:hypothetical protein